MSIIIKGMEMPESCYYCPFADGVWQKGKRCLVNGEEMPRDERGVQQNHINCPLIELPPHGRLIDADALLKHKGNCYDADGHLLYAVGTGNILCAPTIIPEEESES